MKRPTGRPRLEPDERPVDVHLRLPPRQYDAVFKQAREQQLTVTAWIRRHLGQEFRGTEK